MRAIEGCAWSEMRAYLRERAAGGTPAAPKIKKFREKRLALSKMRVRPTRRLRRMLRLRCLMLTGAASAYTRPVDGRYFDTLRRRVNKHDG
jgi:hypothetical protein